MSAGRRTAPRAPLPAAPAEVAALVDRLPEVMLRDADRLGRRLEGLRRQRDPARLAADLERVGREVEAAERRVAVRAAAVPAIAYPAALPVSERREDIMAAIRDAQVVVVAGETGSGKTTQLPKMCLELGRGVRGLIGHTQPRRLAARTVAERIAEELAVPLGEVVGYKVRFTDQSSDRTLVKLMTDGILLAELQNDRDLRAYDTIIVDEAHERSLNIDFLLGYLTRLLPRRPDLKVIITSATIDPGRFSRHFGDAPVVQVSGRTFPVDVRYRPLVADVSDEASDPDGEPEPRDPIDAISDAVSELSGEGPGDILVFLSGEREIRDTADALAKEAPPGTEITPLYGRLSAAEQHRVFEEHTGRRVVLATNVAETSLTVPGIRYVVDPGTARISRYSHRTKVQRLPIEPVSQASANQRAGRCGRVADGICIRLYSEEDYLGRPEFTDPEILRTNLASVILSMTAIGLGDVASFPFLDPPDKRTVRDGVQLLHELGAIDPDESDPRKRLTALGRRLAQLPVDPRLGRMVLEADRNGCVREVMVIAAALSIQDPRERPVDKQQQAAEKHARFTDPDSDFLAYVNLWNHLREQQRELSSSAFRRLCKAEYLNYLRVREWQDVYSQLRSVAQGFEIVVNDQPAAPQQVHVSLLAGLLSHIGLKETEKHEYTGARGARFALFPGSALFKKSPRWVMAAELMETSRLWGRTTARIDPEWAEQLAQHLVKRTYSEPHWEKDRGAVMAFEKVTLYGVPLVASRKVGYAKVDPELCRDLFIRSALVEGEWRTHHTFFAKNRALLEDVGELEHRARRRDILVDDEALYAFYDARIPAEAVSARHFDSWWKTERRERPDLLDFEQAMLVNADAARIDARDYPDTWRQGGLELALTYQFEPGAAADGVTVHVPLAILNQIDADDFAWQIPGLREDLVTALIRSLPKALRVNFVPAPDTARAALTGLRPREEPLLASLGDELHDRTGVDVPLPSWDLTKLPDHLRMTFRVEDERGAALAEGKDLTALTRRLAPKLRASLAASAPDIERSGATTWAFGTLPRTVEQVRGSHTVQGYPALVDEGTTVGVRVLATPAQQERAMRLGTRRLLLLTLANPGRSVAGRLGNAAKLALSRNPHGSVAAMLDDCAAAAVDELMATSGGPARDAEGFAKLRDAVRVDLPETTYAAVTSVEGILARWHQAEGLLRGTTSLVLLPSLSNARAQLDALVHPGFVTATGVRRLPDVERYLRALVHRLERLPHDAARDRIKTAQVAQVQQALDEALASLPADAPVPAALAEVRWMLEELRVSLFAQTVGAAYPVSEKRVLKALTAAVG